MSVPFDLGVAGNPEQQFVEILWQSKWYKFPLVSGSIVTKQPMSPFSPAVQRGDNQRIIDQRMNVVVWNDFSGGFAQRRDDPNIGYTKFESGTLDTRNKGMLVLPPKATLLANSGRTFTGPVWGYTQRVSNVRYEFFYSPANAGIVRLNTNTNAVLSPATMATLCVTELVSFAGKLWATVTDTAGLNASLYTSADNGATWAVYSGFVTLPAAATCRGLCIHDGKLFTFYGTTNTLYATSDGTNWGAVSRAYQRDAANNEQVYQLFEWSTPSGNGRTIYMETTFKRMVLEEEPQLWHQVYSYEGVIETPYRRSHEWRRSQFVYTSMYDPLDPNGLVLVYNGGTTSSVSPRDPAGLPETWFHGITHVFGNVHYLYGFGTGGTIGGVTSTGSIMAMNELGAWHTIMHGDRLSASGSYIVGGHYDNQNVYAMMSNGDIWQCPDPDRLVVHPRANGALYDNGIGSTAWMRSSYDDGGLTNVWKIGAYFLVDAQLADGTPGIPVGSTVKLWYRTDKNQVWTVLPLLGATTSHPVGLLTDLSLDASSLSWPIIQTLPNGLEQLGVPFRRIQWYLEMAKTPSGTSPAIVEISLYYTLWLEQFYSYSMNIDLTEELFGQYEGSYYGYDREYLQKLLENIASTKGYTKMRLGMAGPWQQTVNAVDMLLNHKVQANTGGTITGLTVRDLDAPLVTP